MWDPLDAWPRGRRWLWVALAILVCCLQGPTFIRSLRPPSKGADFFQEWASARNWYGGLAVYTDQEITTEKYLGIQSNKDNVLYIRWNAHPPTSILLAIPFAGLSYSDATLAWNLVSLAAFVASLWLLGRELGITPTWWSIFPMVALLLTCSPFRQQVLQGQLNLVLLLLIVGIWVAERSGRPWLAGWFLAAATAIKLFPGFLFLFFLLRRRWAVLLSGIVSLAAITVTTAAILGPEAYRDYIWVVLPQVSQFRYAFVNASLAGFWGKVFGEGSWNYHQHILPIARLPEIARVGTLLSCSGVLILWARSVWRMRMREGDHGFGLTLLAMLLLSPIAWDHYFLLLTLPLFQLWIVLPHSVLGKSLRLGLLACLWADQVSLWRIFFPEALYYSGSISAPIILVTLLSYQCYMLLGLFALGLVYLGDERLSSHELARWAQPEFVQPRPSSPTYSIPEPGQ